MIFLTTLEVSRAEITVSVLQIKHLSLREINDLCQVTVQVGAEPGFKVGCSGPSLGPACDRHWRHTEWGPDTGNSWNWDPGLSLARAVFLEGVWNIGHVGHCCKGLEVAGCRGGKQWVSQGGAV